MIDKITEALTVGNKISINSLLAALSMFEPHQLKIVNESEGAGTEAPSDSGQEATSELD